MRRYHFHRLEVGQFFDFPIGKLRSVRTQAYVYSVDSSRRFKTSAINATTGRCMRFT